MTITPLKLLVLGRGKTGSLVAEVGRARGHEVRAVGSVENAECAALDPKALADIDVIIDFTTPRAVIENIEACGRAGKNMVVGTTGWYDSMDRAGEAVKSGGIGFVYGANFSIGVNLFFDIARAAAPAFEHGYEGRILERHHVQKKDAPSGTAVALRKVLQEVRAGELLIESEREGDVAGYHELVLDSESDTITLAHNSKSRRGFAEGAVRAAEWIAQRKGFYDFKDVWRTLR